MPDKKPINTQSRWLHNNSDKTPTLTGEQIDEGKGLKLLLRVVMTFLWTLGLRMGSKTSAAFMCIMAVGDVTSSCIKEPKS